MLRLIIEPEAEADLSEAFAWYQNQRPGLGDEFFLAVEARFAAIRRRPETFQSVHRELRRALVRRFPYGILFLVERKTIHVVAVLHANAVLEFGRAALVDSAACDLFGMPEKTS